MNEHSKGGNFPPAERGENPHTEQKESPIDLNDSGSIEEEANLWEGEGTRYPTGRLFQMHFLPSIELPQPAFEVFASSIFGARAYFEAAASDEMSTEQLAESNLSPRQLDLVMRMIRQGSGNPDVPLPVTEDDFRDGLNMIWRTLMMTGPMMIRELVRAIPEERADSIPMSMLLVRDTPTLARFFAVSGSPEGDTFREELFSHLRFVSDAFRSKVEVVEVLERFRRYLTYPAVAEDIAAGKVTGPLIRRLSAFNSEIGQVLQRQFEITHPQLCGKEWSGYVDRLCCAHSFESLVQYHMQQLRPAAKKT